MVVAGTQRNGKQVAISAPGNRDPELNPQQRKIIDILVDMAIKDLLDQGGKCETGVKEPRS